METYYYPQFNGAVVHVALFDDVANSAGIRACIIQAARILGIDGDTEREAVNFAFIDARLVGYLVLTRVNVLSTLCVPDLQSTSPPDGNLSGSFVGGAGPASYQNRPL